MTASRSISVCIRTTTSRSSSTTAARRGRDVRRRADAARRRAAGAQGCAGRSRGRRPDRPLQRGDRLCAGRAAPGQLGQRAHDAHARAAADDLPLATRAAPLPPLEGYTFEGFRNADGSVGTRNILAITTTVQCVSGVVEHAVKRIKAELLPRYPNVDDVVGRAHVRLRRGDRRARCRHPDPHAAQHQPESELRRRGDDREPRLREAAARAPAAARHDSGRGRRCDRQRRRGVPAGRRARRLQLDDRLDHDDGRIASRAAQPPPPRDVPGIGSRRRRAVRRQRCVLGLTANPAVGFAADLLARARRSCSPR